jgi:AcrR family transcriptional regulator
MIDAAIEVFGELGYDAASTRFLAERAGVNLGAIPYHFGGKRELYLAAAQVIADFAREKMNSVVALLQEGDRANLLDRINQAVRRYFCLVVGSAEPETWVSFFVRSERDADDAFRIIYEEAVARFARALIQAIAEATGCEVEDQNLRIQVSILVASIANFRTLRNLTLTTLGWDQLDAVRLEQLEKAVRQLVLGQLAPLSTRSDASTTQTEPKVSGRRRRKAVPPPP